MQRTVTISGSAPRRPGVIAMAALLAAGAASGAARPDFSGIWQVADPALVVRPEVNATEQDYTAKAWSSLQEFRRKWDPKIDDPAKFCVREGMPNTMTSRARDYAVDIQQTPARITMLFEFLDNVRVIHLGKGAVPDGVAPSNNGYSQGRWDGDTLVIETTMLKARNPVGPVQRSDEAHIVERWTLKKGAKPGERRLEVDMQVSDSGVFRRTMPAHQVFKPVEVGAVITEYACTDALWDDHVEQRRRALAGQ